MNASAQAKSLKMKAMKIFLIANVEKWNADGSFLNEPAFSAGRDDADINNTD